MKPLRPLGITQGVAHAALVGPEEIARHAKLPEIVRLGSNESPFGPGPKARAAILDEMEHAHRYGDPSALAVREAIAHHHGVTTKHVAVGAGIDDLLGWAVRAYLAPGMPAIAAHGAFPTFEMHANGYGAHLELVPYRADGHVDLEGFLNAARRLGGGLIFLPNPDNPSGSSHEWADVLRFLDALPDNTLIIHDEAYANFLPHERRFPRDTIDERMIRMRTFSKEYGLAGLRVGYALATPSTIAALEAVRLLYGVNRIAQAAALASLDDAAFMEDVVARIALGREEYRSLGKRLGIPTRPSDTNFILFDFDEAVRAASVLESLLRRGIHVRKPSVPPLDRYVRVSVGTPQERAGFAAALEAISEHGGMSPSAPRRTFSS